MEKCSNVFTMDEKCRISLIDSTWRIKHNEKEIQAKMKMCTGPDVSLAQYFNRKLNTDDGCHWR